MSMIQIDESRVNTPRRFIDDVDGIVFTYFLVDFYDDDSLHANIDLNSWESRTVAYSTLQQSIEPNVISSMQEQVVSYN